MKISIIHPSRGRAKQAYETAIKWLSRTFYDYNIEYILSIDHSDSEQSKYLIACSHLGKVVVSDNHSAIEAINNAAKIATGDLFIVISDDFDCPMGWDKLLLEALADKSDFVVKTDDGQQEWIITLPIMDRVYYERFGYIYNPSYEHLFADTEMTHVADLLCRNITLPIKFPHNHYTTGITPKDPINVKNDATWAQGEKIYLERVKDNFGLTTHGKLQCGINHINWLRAHGIQITE